jgi:hypothetical protein
MPFSPMKNLLPFFDISCRGKKGIRPPFSFFNLIGWDPRLKNC